MRSLGVATSMPRHNTFTLSELYQYFDLLRNPFPLSIAKLSAWMITSTIRFSVWSCLPSTPRQL